MMSQTSFDSHQADPDSRALNLCTMACAAGPELLQKAHPLPTPRPRRSGEVSVQVPLASSSSMVVLVLSEDSWGNRETGVKMWSRTGRTPPLVE